jgi:predicted ATP-dependent endonuclease of OLD family
MKINKLHINNFRSLVDFKVDEFDSTTIFYGENNAGKSNILKILELIFKRKVQYSDNDFTTPKNFYEGVVRGFSNNFFNNDEKNIIDFLVEVKLLKCETEVQDTINKLFKTWPDELIFSIEGKILNSPHGEDFAEMQTNKIKVNGISIYEFDSKTIKFFPTLQKGETKNEGLFSNAFSHLVNPLNDCVYIIGSNRETHPTPFNTEFSTSISPSDFKKFLYNLYLNEKKHTVFEEINSIFNSEPFKYGTLSFSIHNEELEIMIKNDGVRLPIKHLGSGVEQILFIIACLVSTKSRIICIEELEQNLAPRMQNLALIKIQSMISKNLDQLILSSHSSVFLNTKLSNAIYYIERKNLKTFVSEKKGGKLGKKMKQHLIDTALPYDTYTEDELKRNIEEVNKLTEKRFKM